MKDRECPSCQGSGIDPDLGTDTRPEVRCRTCNGDGIVDMDECRRCEDVLPESEIGHDGICGVCRAKIGAES